MATIVGKKTLVTAIEAAGAIIPKKKNSNFYVLKITVRHDIGKVSGMDAAAGIGRPAMLEVDFFAQGSLHIFVEKKAVLSALKGMNKSVRKVVLEEEEDGGLAISPHGETGKVILPPAVGQKFSSFNWTDEVEAHLVELSEKELARLLLSPNSADPSDLRPHIRCIGFQKSPNIVGSTDGNSAVMIPKPHIGKDALVSKAALRAFLTAMRKTKSNGASVWFFDPDYVLVEAKSDPAKSWGVRLYTENEIREFPPLKDLVDKAQSSRMATYHPDRDAFVGFIKGAASMVPEGFKRVLISFNGGIQMKSINDKGESAMEKAFSSPRAVKSGGHEEISFLLNTKLLLSHLEHINSQYLNIVVPGRHKIPVLFAGNDDLASLIMEIRQ